MFLEGYYFQEYIPEFLKAIQFGLKIKLPRPEMYLY
jgi:hypothetical protein